VLGYLDASAGSTESWFAVQLKAGQTYTFPTSTPAVGGPGLYTNALIPHIELYDASGTTLLASGTKLADGRNESITFTPSAKLVELAGGEQPGVAGELARRRLDDERRAEEVQDLGPGGGATHAWSPGRERTGRSTRLDAHAGP
jgi:hypothetical protein